MKRVNKFISLLLMLVLIVTLLPKNLYVSAAEKRDPQTYSTMKLYLGGDITGKIPESKYCKVWNKGDATSVTFTSSDTYVAKVDKTKGKVTAVNVGTCVITVKFSYADGESISKRVKVTVKENAGTAEVTENSKNRVADMWVGEVFQMVTMRVGVSSGNVVYKGKDVVTSGFRYYSDNEDVVKVSLTSGLVTAVAPGTTEIDYWGVQGEYPEKDENGKVIRYLPVTEKQIVYVNVKGMASAEQTGVNEITVDVGTPNFALEVIRGNMIKVYRANEETGEPIEVPVKEIKSFEGEPHKVILVFDELKGGTDYILTLHEQKLSVPVEAAKTIKD